MPLQKEAMTKADFERSEKGLAPLKSVKLVRPDDVQPEMTDEIKLSDITGEIKLEFAGRYPRRNDEGVLFVGYIVKIKLLSKKEPETIEGWMVEGKFKEFVRHFRDQIDVSIICW
jgi:hypothetical protein